MSVYKKLNDARNRFHALKLEKTGLNKFAGYKYFELGDFLIPALKVFQDVGLCAVVSFGKELATMTIIDVDQPSDIGVFNITSPMGSAALKGCHEVQNIGAVETYQRRYLWVAALEIVEHDALDATAGKPDTKTDVKPPTIPASFKSSATMGIYESLSPEKQSKVTAYADLVKEHFAADDIIGAFELASEVKDSDEKPAFWSLLDSTCRAAIKKHADSLKPQLKAA